MKFYSYLLFLVILATSCNSSDPTDALGDDSSFFKCTIDGNSHDISGFYAYAVEDESEFTIYGTEDLIENEAAEIVYIVIEEDKGSGNYLLENGQDGIGYHTNQKGDFTYYTIPDGTSGEVNITEKTSSRIKGTFNFTAINPVDGSSVQISNGEFDVEIRE